MKYTKNEILKKYEHGGNIVLSTCKDNIVTSRMVSVISIDDSLYFTSVKRMGNTKNDQIEANSNVALCDMSRQMTGVANILGLITEPQFSDILNQYKCMLFEAYSKFGHNKCLLIKIDIKTFKDFIFIDGKPDIINITF